MFILLFRAVISIITSIVMTRKIKQAQQKQAAWNQQMMEMKEKQQPVEFQPQMVKDDYCGRMVSRDKAYIVRSEDKSYHFCSWECRQKYISSEAG
jgi:YHS domain-containing protein